VGVAVQSSTLTPQESTAVASQLRSNADAALFRAKSGGRNTVRHYSDILDRHGRVLQHHSATGLVAIDIGRTVGVSVGQEFTVFHPDFSGDKPFLYDDGRTHKRLGRYPRHPCARLIVIDAQQEISFCRIISQDLHASLPPGSHLELVPVGSIAHLLAPEPKLDVLRAPVLTPPEQLPKLVQEIANANIPTQAAIVALLDVNKLAKERGTAFVNTSLANLYKALREVFPIHKAIAQILPTQFAIVLSDPDPSNLSSSLSTVINTAAAKSAGLATFRAGAYASLTSPKSIKGDNSDLRPENALEYARFAIASQDPDPGPVCFFTPIIAMAVIKAWRNKQRYREALTDYLRLKQLGIEYSGVENLVALSALSIGESEKTLAIEAVGRAVTLNPDKPLLRANQAYIECVFGDRVRAWQLFQEIPSDYTLLDVYHPRRAQAMYAAYKADPGSISTDTVISYLKQVLAMDASVLHRSYRAELQKALDSISQPQ
jgi:GGDEF domain-containing protein